MALRQQNRGFFFTGEIRWPIGIALRRWNAFFYLMFFPFLKLSDWGMEKFKLVVILFGVVLIIIILAYIALSSKENE